MFIGTGNFEKFVIGLDSIAQTRQHMLDAIKRSSELTYPPYNIRKTTENTYVVEIAAAGFTIDNFEITLDGDALRIACIPSKEDTSTFLWNGLSQKSWARDFILSEGVRVTNASLVNGLLKIFLEHSVPVEKKPLRINIEQPTSKETRTLLNEDSSF